MSHADPRCTLQGRRRRALRSVHRRREGAAALEFALLLPFFILLILGLIDFGHMLFVVNTITNAAREGARRGVVQRDSDNIVPAAEAAATAYMTASGIGGSAASATLEGDDVVVTVALPSYTNITGFGYDLPGLSSPGLGGSRTLSSVSTMRWEFAPTAGSGP